MSLNLALKCDEHFLRTCMPRHLLRWLNESLASRKLDSARFFDAAQGPLQDFCIWPHPLVPRRPWIPTFFSPADPPCQKPLLCEKMTPCSASPKSVPRLFLILPTSWLGLCTTLKCPEAKRIFPSDSLAGAASFSTSPPWWTLRFQELLLSLNSSDSDWTSTPYTCLPTNIGSSLRGAFL